MSSYKNLKVWNDAIELVVQCYRLCHRLPDHEKYGLISQIQRASVSIPANIAEGNGRRYRKEYLFHLSVSYGSLAELETHLEISVRLGYLTKDEIKSTLNRCSEIGKMLNGLRKSLANN